MANRKIPGKRKVRALQRATGMSQTQAVAQLMRINPLVAACPVCGSYDLDSIHGGGGQTLQVCNVCPWEEA